MLDLNGGTLRNAIPREGHVTLAVAADKVEQLKKLSQNYLATLKDELIAVEKNLTLVLEPVSTETKALTKETQQRFVALLNATPNGVIRMSDAVKGVVETSLNVGVVTMNEHEAEIVCLIRSLIDSVKIT